MSSSILFNLAGEKIFLINFSLSSTYSAISTLSPSNSSNICAILSHHSHTQTHTGSILSSSVETKTFVFIQAILPIFSILIIHCSSSGIYFCIIALTKAESDCVISKIISEPCFLISFNNTFSSSHIS